MEVIEGTSGMGERLCFVGSGNTSHAPILVLPFQMLQPVEMCLEFQREEQCWVDRVLYWKVNRA